MTLTLNQPWSNMHNEHRLIILDIRVICKSHQGFKRYRTDTKVWRTDRQTNGRTDRQITVKNNMSLHFMGGDIISVNIIKPKKWDVPSFWFDVLKLLVAWLLHLHIIITLDFISHINPLKTLLMWGSISILT